MNETPDTTDIEASAPDQAAETSPAEHRTPDVLFRYSEFVHIGPGADHCEDGTDGSCGDPLHFHAWCRLPNQFQHASIREKAMAAKARRQRQLRDPDTDGCAVLEGELDALLRSGAKEPLIEELSAQHYLRDNKLALQSMIESEEFGSIEEDLERFRALNALPEDERPADEVTELQNHIDTFQKSLESSIEEEQRPYRESLEALEPAALVDLVRDLRIESEGNDEFLRTWRIWEQYIGTLAPRPADQGAPVDRKFRDVSHLTDQAAPEVIEALQAVFGELEAAMARAKSGNS